jgi:hypothetical protein
MSYFDIDSYLARLESYEEQRNRTELEDEQILTDEHRAGRLGVSDE